MKEENKIQKILNDLEKLKKKEARKQIKKDYRAMKNRTERRK